MKWFVDNSEFHSPKSEIQNCFVFGGIITTPDIEALLAAKIGEIKKLYCEGKPKVWDTYTLKQGDTTQEISINDKTADMRAWIDSVIPKNSKRSEILPLPQEKAVRLQEPRSLIVLSGQARYEWAHAIPAQKSDMIAGIKTARQRRVSLTFRKVILP